MVRSSTGRMGRRLALVGLIGLGHLAVRGAGLAPRPSGLRPSGLRPSGLRPSGLRRAAASSAARTRLYNTAFSSDLTGPGRGNPDGKQKPQGDAKVAPLFVSVDDHIEIKAPLDDIDVNAPPAEPEAQVPWLPAGVRIPELTADEEAKLAEGGAVMRQTRTRGSGEGFVVMELGVPPEEAWLYLSDYKGYVDFISTVREALIQPPRRSAVRGQVATPATFKLSRFRLKVNVVLRQDDTRWNIGFDLDPECKNLVLSRASGFWQLQPYVPESAQRERGGGAAAG
eukprot:CAMPEP_0118866960 /NCGR_PEP_ID=MMETSP1163-20130328/10723_1 /TAXON_ID=124430 /ORGANISM="Phaeomonas parva, Strain CCMP2877" /LENGTH=282 /DNA_ID=CAMNT_0006801333 /DNA_START=390 /DNA_END=1234 /DNA_ORIENTATION=-